MDDVLQHRPATAEAHRVNIGTHAMTGAEDTAKEVDSRDQRASYLSAHSQADTSKEVQPDTSPEVLRDDGKEVVADAVVSPQRRWWQRRRAWIAAILVVLVVVGVVVGCVVGLRGAKDSAGSTPAPP